MRALSTLSGESIFVKTVKATEHIRRMKGGSQSHLMKCSDGTGRSQFFVVKFQNNPQHQRILANEWIGTHVAAAMGLPAATPAIVKVDRQIIEAAPGMTFELPRSSVRCGEGFHFGSRYPGDPRTKHSLHDFLPCETFSAVDNVRDFLGMLVFDKWTCNTDSRQIVFVCKHGAYRALMIDQGFCFNAGEWNFPDSPLRGLYARRCVYDHVTGIDSFEPWLSWAESEEAAACVTALIDTMPPEWYDSDRSALEQLVERLIRRRSRIRTLVQEAGRCRSSPFRNWRETCTIPIAELPLPQPTTVMARLA
jgi:hypothetical protein